jgi:hypothetical protein
MKQNKLFYLGNETKIFTLKTLPATHIWRRTEVSENTIWTIGHEKNNIPRDIAKLFVREYPAFFKIDQIEVDNVDYAKNAISRLVNEIELTDGEKTKLFSDLFNDFVVEDKAQKTRKSNRK